MTTSSRCDTCWNVASSNPSRRNSASTARRKSCSCVDAHLQTRRSQALSSLPPMHAVTTRLRVTIKPHSLDGRDVSGGKHLVQGLHHVTHSHQSCDGRVGGRVLADLRGPAADVQASSRVAGQSGHLPSGGEDVRERTCE